MPTPLPSVSALATSSSSMSVPSLQVSCGCVALVFVSRPALVAGLLSGPAQHGRMAGHPGTHMSSCPGRKPIFLSLASMQPLRVRYSMGPLPGWCFTEPPRCLHSSMPTQVQCSTRPPRGQCSWGVSIRPILSGPTRGSTGWLASFGGTVWPATAGLTACRLVGSMLGQPPYSAPRRKLPFVF